MRFYKICARATQIITTSIGVSHGLDVVREQPHMDRNAIPVLLFAGLGLFAGKIASKQIENLAKKSTS